MSLSDRFESWPVGCFSWMVNAQLISRPNRLIFKRSIRAFKKLRRVSEGTQKGSPHPITITEPGMQSDFIEGMFASFDHDASFFYTEVFHRARRRLTRL